MNKKRGLLTGLSYSILIYYCLLLFKHIDIQIHSLFTEE
ncbi:hypothetical protein FSS13T_00560 [Flavobacterium saliperosum S13]|uniref:Uncharacterized protein n=1 Tax=Flavobacterium saliperosum S13 TaxID=1341155 RepID=A0ABN0QKD6_9FLAO|nr:hypothetical protein FSS13T_00560 [Flavobacterium saliperosum S13]